MEIRLVWCGSGCGEEGEEEKEGVRGWCRMGNQCDRAGFACDEGCKGGRCQSVWCSACPKDWRSCDSFYFYLFMYLFWWVYIQQSGRCMALT